jgi:hypothetical protein
MSMSYSVGRMETFSAETHYIHNHPVLEGQHSCFSATEAVVSSVGYFTVFQYLKLYNME